jgi:hypothetical protein
VSQQLDESKAYDEWQGLYEVWKQAAGLPFSGKAAAYMKYLHWKPAIFEDRTGLAADTYRKINRGELNNPKKYTAMALCTGLDMGYRLAADLLQSAGLALSPFDETDQAYEFILTEMRGRGLDACNQFLEARGLPPLGTQERNTDRIGKVKIA